MTFFPSFLRPCKSLALIAIYLVFTSIAHGANILPTVSLDRETIDCLESSDWDCALERLIPLYYERGPKSNLHYYIVHAYRGNARIALEQKAYSEAAAQLNEALSFATNDHTLFAELGLVYFLLSDYDRAEKMYLSAAGLAPDNPEYLQVLGKISYLKGDLGDASYFWEQALSLEPNNNRLKLQLEKIRKQTATENQGTTELSHLFRITFDRGMDRDLYNEVWKMFENSWYDLGQQLDLYPRRQIPVLLLTNESFTSLTNAPEWSSGMYEGQIKIPVAEFDRDRLQEVITHEYLHALIYDTMANRCPWWLNEGLAQYFSLPDGDKRKRLDIAREHIRSHGQVKLEELPGSLQSRTEVGIAYSLALSATDFLMNRFAIGVTRSVLSSMGNGMNFAEALNFNSAYTYSEFQEMWHNSL